MTSGPFLSVIIPTYDTREMTLACCREALDALDGRGEVIVSDDGSSDGTDGAVRGVFPEIRSTRSETNRGYSAAANAGADLARGELLLFLNSDAFLSHEAVTRILEVMTHGDAAIASPRLADSEGHPAWTGGREPSIVWLAVLASGVAAIRPRRTTPAAGVTEVDWVSGAAIVVTRAAWNQFGPFADRYRFYGQDLELCIRAKRSGARVVIIEDARVRHLHGATIAGGGPMRHDPVKLWSDLLTWAAFARGRAWAAVARLVMIFAASARIAVRVVVTPGKPSFYGLETAAYLRALRGLVFDPLTRRR